MYLKDLPPPSCHPETLTKARKWLKQNHKDFRQTANFAIFNKDSHKPLINQSCHKAISISDLPDRECVATEIGHKRNQKPDKIVEGVLRYFLYDSYASPFILNKDDFEECRDYGVVVSADIPAAFMQNILIMSRHFYECSNIAFIVFDDLTKQGIHPDVAFFSCFMTNISTFSIKVTYEQALINPMYGTYGHRTQSFPKSLEEFSLIVNRETGKGFEGELSRIYRHDNNYKGGISLFSHKKHTFRDLYSYTEIPFIEELMKVEEVNQKLKKARYIDPSLYKPPNPFNPRQSIIRENQISVKEFIEIIVPYINQAVAPKGISIDC